MIVSNFNQPTTSMIQGELAEPILPTHFLPHFSKYRFIKYWKHDWQFSYFFEAEFTPVEVDKTAYIFDVVISYAYIS